MNKFTRVKSFSHYISNTLLTTVSNWTFNILAVSHTGSSKDSVQHHIPPVLYLSYLASSLIFIPHSHIYTNSTLEQSTNWHWNSAGGSLGVTLASKCEKKKKKHKNPTQFPLYPTLFQPYTFMWCSIVWVNS